MKLYVLLIVTAAFLGMFQRPLHGLLWGLVAVLVLAAIATLFPDTSIGIAMQSLSPFS
jgi:hypothetical protein